MIESKNWAGEIVPGSTGDTVACHLPGGKLQEHRSPINRNPAKVAVLRGTFPATWNIQGLGVFARDGCTLSPNLPLALLAIRDLSYWLRTQRDQHAESGTPTSTSRQREMSRVD